MYDHAVSSCMHACRVGGSMYMDLATCKKDVKHSGSYVDL